MNVELIKQMSQQTCSRGVPCHTSSKSRCKIEVVLT